MLSIIITAYNETSMIRDCLDSLLAQTHQQELQIIVAVNGCSDTAADITHSYQTAFQDKTYSLQVLEITKGNKNNALNQSGTIAERTEYYEVLSYE